MDAALTICNSLKRETEVPRESDVAQQLLQLFFATRQVRPAIKLAHHSISSPGGRLCLGFLRCFFGTMSFGDGTAPTRSRASRRISVGMWYFFGFFFTRSNHRIPLQALDFAASVSLA
jgi:hypothetical protein